MNLNASLPIHTCAALIAAGLVLACSDSEEPAAKPTHATPPVARTAPAPAHGAGHAPRPVGKTVKEQLETVVELPKAYPADAPLFPGTQPNTAGFHNGRITASFSTQDSIEEVTRFTDDFLVSNGWGDLTRAELPTGAILQGVKGSRSISVLLSTLQEGGRDVTVMVVATDPE